MAAAALADLPGGRKALGVTPTSAVNRDALIRAGMQVRSAAVLKVDIAVPDSLLAELLGISEKTLSRARAGRGRLDSVNSDRLYQVARIVAPATGSLAC